MGTCGGAQTALRNMAMLEIASEMGEGESRNEKTMSTGQISDIFELWVNRLSTCISNSATHTLFSLSSTSIR